MKLAIVIPAYNEEGSIEKVLKTIPKKINGIKDISTIVVDDGSKDKTFKIAKKHADCAVSHLCNLGVGTATISGLDIAKKNGSDIVVTLDGDGQHNPENIASLIKPILDKKADIVIGTRMKNTKEMPKIKVFGNWAMNFITFLFFRVWVTDSQSGMKAFSKKSLNELQLDSIEYEICSEIIGEAKYKKLKITEVRIDTIYTDYSKAKGQNIFNAINIFTKIITIKNNKKR